MSAMTNGIYPKRKFWELKEQTREVQRLPSGYARDLRSRKFGSTLVVREVRDEDEFWPS